MLNKFFRLGQLHRNHNSSIENFENLNFSV